MNILAKLMAKLRRGTASPEEIENLDRRLFCLGAAASAGGLIARPTVVDFGAVAPVATFPSWMTPSFEAAMFGYMAYFAHRTAVQQGLMHENRLGWVRKVEGT